MCWTSGIACGLVIAALGQVQETQIRRVTTVIGSGVRLQEGARYGEVQDVILNENGCVEYVVVAYEDRYVVVPWTIATVTYEDRVVTLDVTEQRLSQVTFTRDQWRDITFSRVNQTVGKVFGTNATQSEGRSGRNEVRRDASDRAGRDEDRDESRRPDEDRPRAKGDTPNAKQDGDRPRAKDETTPDRSRGDRPRAKAGDRPKADRPEAKTDERPKSDRPNAKTDERPKGEAGQRSGDQPKAKGAEPKGNGGEPTPKRS
jgi:hypothetical protein